MHCLVYNFVKFDVTNIRYKSAKYNYNKLIIKILRLICRVALGRIEKQKTPLYSTLALFYRGRKKYVLI